MIVRIARLVPAVAAVGLTGLLLAGCGSAAAETEQGSQSFGAISRVELTADSGTIELRPGPDGASTVDRNLRWSGTTPQVTAEMAGDVLRVTATCGGADDCNTDLTLTVPATSAVTARVGAGNVTATGLTGAMDLSSDAGNVGGTGLGPAQATLRTKAGNVEAAFATAPPTVDAESNAGNVTLTLPTTSVYEVNATSAAGNVKIGVADTPGADSRIRARSSAGNVTVQPG